MSFDGNPLCTAALAHPVTSSLLYIHLLNQVLWHLNCVSRLVRCDISSASLSHLQMQVSSAGCRLLLLGFGAAAHMGVAGATDDCAVGAVGAFTAVVGTAGLAAVDGVLAGWSVTSTLGCVSGLTASAYNFHNL